MTTSPHGWMRFTSATHEPITLTSLFTCDASDTGVYSGIGAGYSSLGSSSKGGAEGLAVGERGGRGGD
jgi:hypothetical protein